MTPVCLEPEKWNLEFSVVNASVTVNWTVRFEDVRRTTWVEKGDTVAEILVNEEDSPREHQVEKVAPKGGCLVPLTVANSLYTQPQFGGAIALISNRLAFGGRKEYEVVKPAASWLEKLGLWGQHAEFKRSLEEGLVAPEDAAGTEFVWGKMVKDGKAVEELLRTKKFDSEAVYYLVEDGKTVRREKGRMGAVFLEILPGLEPIEPIPVQEVVGWAASESSGSNQEAEKESATKRNDERSNRDATVPKGRKNGYLYVLQHPQMPDVVKIGSTERTPRERAQELSSATGVPGPFEVAYERPVANPRKTEMITHRILSEYRWSSDREFFEVTEEEAIDAIEEATLRCEEGS